MHARSRAALSRAEEEGGQRARDKSTLASFHYWKFKPSDMGIHRYKDKMISQLWKQRKCEVTNFLLWLTGKFWRVYIFPLINYNYINETHYNLLSWHASYLHHLIKTCHICTQSHFLYIICHIILHDT
jgi:hypothetical protein